MLELKFKKKTNAQGDHWLSYPFDHSLHSQNERETEIRPDEIRD